MKNKRLGVERHVVKYKKLSLKHYADKKKIKRLNPQICKLIDVYRRMIKKFIKYSPKYFKSIEMSDYLHAQLKKMLRSNRDMSLAKRTELLRLLKRLPANSFEDRVRFMELSRIYGQDNRDIFKHSQMKDVRELSKKWRTLQQSLKRLNEQMLTVTKEIDAIESAVHETHITKNKMKIMAWWAAHKGT